MRRIIVWIGLWIGFGINQGFAEQATVRWPLAGDIDLSSGFGDYRENRFHAGIDLRTDGKIGKPVLAPVDGYVMRIKTSYFGYGRGLYFKGKDGYQYVFGHLSAYFPALEKRLRVSQTAIERYYVDVTFPDDSIPIKQGELLAYSGETGVGAPHLHFEKRTADNIPLNPLTHGYELTDKTPPVFTEIGFQLTDSHSLLENGRRELFLPIAGQKEAYRLDTILYLNAPFGVLAECSDMMNPQGMTQAVYKLSWYVNDTLYYQSVFDSLSYDQAESAKLEYDYFKATDGEKRVRRLFNKTGDTFSGSRSLRIGKGVFGIENETPGVKHSVIVAEDAFGNTAKLSFTFVWGPPHALFALDSTHIAQPDTTQFYFSPTVSSEQIKIDSIAVLLNRADAWGKPAEVTVKALKNGAYRVASVAQQTSSAVLRIMVYTANGLVVPDTIFNGLNDNNSAKLSMSYDFVDGGMLVALNSQTVTGSRPQLSLYRDDSLLGVEYPRFFTMKQQIAFVPAQSKYAHITRVGLALSRNSNARGTMIDSLNIITIGVSTKQTFSIDDKFTLTFKDSNLYSPQFIELKKTVFMAKGIRGIVSDHYQILPEKILTRTPFELQIKLMSGQGYVPFTGLCWLDKDKDAWVWLGGNPKEDVITATSYGGGSFAAVFDKEPPAVTIYGVKDKMTYADSKPKISFMISDDLSGIEDDRNIIVKINNKWTPVEYDAEKKRGTVLLGDPLPNGDNHLSVIVTDRAGHQEEHNMIFSINAPAKN